MAKDIETLLATMRGQPQNVRFNEACKVANHYFGEPRSRGTSHHVWKMPWAGDPRVNLQNDGGRTKRYQVEQLLAAIDRIESERAMGPVGVAKESPVRESSFKRKSRP